jgi:hypothetical protein
VLCLIGSIPVMPTLLWRDGPWIGPSYTMGPRLEVFLQTNASKGYILTTGAWVHGWIADC